MARNGKNEAHAQKWLKLVQNWRNRKNNKNGKNVAY